MSETETKLNLTLVLGYSCSGKETYMRSIYGGTGLRVSAEFFCVEERAQSLVTLLDQFTDGAHLIIEGFPIHRRDYLEKLQNHNVKYVITYAPLFILRQRLKTRKVELNWRDVQCHYHGLSRIIDFGKVAFYDTFENIYHTFANTERFWDEWDRINRPPTDTDEFIFLDSITDKDNHYADIILPHCTLKGVTPIEETWDKIKKLGVDFQDKVLLDIGCYEGYILHRALEDGALNVLGLDAHKGHLQNAVKIAWLKQSPANFLYFDINFNNLWFKRDIELCLNTLHYTDPSVSLPKLFQYTRELVFEVNDEQVELVKQYAQGYTLAEQCKGRVGRTILYFQED